PGGGDAGPWLSPAAPALHRRPAPSPRPQPAGLRLRDALRRRALPLRARRASGLAARRSARRRVPPPLPRRHSERTRRPAFRPRRPARRGGRMNDLADGFARHLVDWATTLGAPADSLALLDTVARRLATATSAGHVCVALAAFAGSIVVPIEVDFPQPPDEAPPDWDEGVFANGDVRDDHDAVARMREQLLASGVVIDAAQALSGRSAHPLVV